MPPKSWYDLSPQEVVEAIKHLDKGSFRGLSFNLVESRLDAVSGALLPDVVVGVKQHLLEIKPRVIRPHIPTK